MAKQVTADECQRAQQIIKNKIDKRVTELHEKINKANLDARERVGFERGKKEAIGQAYRSLRILVAVLTIAWLILSIGLVVNSQRKSAVEKKALDAIQNKGD